jgi:hypothetical protein
MSYVLCTYVFMFCRLLNYLHSHVSMMCLFRITHLARDVLGVSATEGTGVKEAMDWLRQHVSQRNPEHTGKHAGFDVFCT